MGTNEVLRVNADGTVTHEPLNSHRERNEALQEIIRMIQDPDTPLAPIKRKIAVEIAVASRDMVSLSSELDTAASMDIIKVKALESQVKALRELGKELMESDVLSKKDFLNFDGPKLNYVLEEYRQGAIDCLKKIGIDESSVQQFLRQWRDLMMEREQTIRRTTEKVEFDEKK
jgi:hypothetical protein